MTAAHVPLLSADDARAVAADIGASAYLAEFNIFRALLNHPRLARAVDELLTTLLDHNALDARLRQLAIMRVAWLTASDYEWAVHWRVSQRFGVPAADLAAVRDWHARHEFSARDRAVLAAADEIVRDGVVSYPTWLRCERELGSDPAVLIELVTAVGTWRMISTMLRTLQIPLEDSDSRWPPDGRLPPKPTVHHQETPEGTP